RAKTGEDLTSSGWQGIKKETCDSLESSSSTRYVKRKRVANNSRFIDDSDCSSSEGESEANDASDSEVRMSDELSDENIDVVSDDSTGLFAKQQTSEIAIASTKLLAPNNEKANVEEA